MSRFPGKQLAKYLGGEYLFGIARSCLCLHLDNPDEAILINELLTAASELGHEEATWLLHLWKKHRAVQQYAEGDYEVRIDCIKDIFTDDDSSRSLAYFADYCGSEDVEFELAECAASSGDPYGEYILATCYHAQEKHAEAIDYYWRAGHRGIGAAYYMLAVQYKERYSDWTDENHHVRLHLEAAELGEILSMGYVADDYHNGHLSSVLGENLMQEIKWRIRMEMFEDGKCEPDDDHFGYMQSKRKIETFFAAGRELDGCLELLPSLKAILNNQTVKEYICMHRQIAGSARAAALTIMACFKHVLSKDMRVMIAKLVYASRLEPFIWYKNETNQTVKYSFLQMLGILQ